MPHPAASPSRPCRRAWSPVCMTSPSGMRAAVVLVSHVGPIKALLCTALDVPMTTGQRLFLDSATVSVIDSGGR